MIFRDRESAGRILATLLEEYRDSKDTVVVALPRGGVPVGAEIAKALNLPLDIFFVKKIPSPFNEEAGIGAVSENGLLEVDSKIVSALGIDEDYILKRAKEKLEDMRKKRALYGHPRVDYSGKRVILTDDGVATGSSMLLASKALKKEGAKEVIIAVPVAPSKIIPVLQRVADRVVVYESVDNFMAVGQFYQDFHQLDNNEVIEILKEFKR